MADAGEGDILGNFDTWLADVFWPAIEKLYNTEATDNSILDFVKSTKTPGGSEKSTTSSTTLLGQTEATVEQVKPLTASEDRPKFHIEINLPEGTTYEVGDYLEIYPYNSQQNKETLLQSIKAQGHDQTDPLVEMLCSRYGLNQPASSKSGGQNFSQGQHIASPSTVRHRPPAHAPTPLLHLVVSPLPSPAKCTLTWSLVAHNGGEPGLASHYLAGLQPGAPLACSHKQQQQQQQNPSASPAAVAPAILFVGRRSPQHALYRTELESLGDIVDVRYAYSRGVDSGGGEGTDGGEEGKEKGGGFAETGRACGSRGVKEAVRRIYREAAAERRCGAKTEAEVDEWWVDILRERYAVDVF
ncbi:hypothetical protein Hte_005288 [Hypoxylon texense]